MPTTCVTLNACLWLSPSERCHLPFLQYGVLLGHLQPVVQAPPCLHWACRRAAAVAGQGVQLTLLQLYWSVLERRSTAGPAASYQLHAPHCCSAACCELWGTPKSVGDRAGRRAVTVSGSLSQAQPDAWPNKAAAVCWLLRATHL